MKNAICLLLIILCFYSCSNDDDFSSYNDQQRYLVSKVYDYQNRLLAAYIYDENNQLVERKFTDPTTGNSSDLIFNYAGNRLSQIRFIDHTHPNFSNDKFFFYDSRNRIKRMEVFQNGNMLSHLNYRYDPNGLVSNLYTDTGFTFNFFEYDNHSNLIQVTNYYVDQITGERMEQVKRFTYDASNRKPSFNLDYLFQIDLLPKMGSEVIYERNLSCTNITFSEDSGTRWSYEYDANSLPISIQTEYDGTITTEPMVLHIEYISL